MIIPESVVELTDIYSNETVNRLLHDAENFLSYINQIDIIGRLITVCFDKYEFMFLSIFALDISNSNNRF